ncbi:DUF2975 domain-containing protein [Flavobacterium sp.]|uniref:DUF2975 domain-containing protein n=3 Tax=Flavobacterium sp. TaxID=239 RepID=UPI0040341D32
MEDQQRKDRLVSRLYFISAGLFALAGVLTAVTLAFDIFQKDPYRNFTFMPNHITGYTLPVKMNVTTFDTLVSYERPKIENTPSRRRTFILKTGSNTETERLEANSILNDPDYKTTFITRSKQVHSDDEFNVNIGEIDMAPLSAEGFILVRPDSLWFTLLLAIRNYSTYAVVLFVLFWLMQLFRRLKNDFTFNASLSRSIWLIGNSLLLYQFLLLVTGTIIEKYISSVMITETAGDLYSGRQIMSLSISFGGSIIMLFSGLALVVLSKLLNYGYELQQENDLTI